jgi:hypothetical protein
MQAIEELGRIPSPSPAPQALSCDGDRLWISSRDTSRIYGLEAHTAAVFEEAVAPGIPWGGVVTGDDIRFVCGEGPDDDRFIRRYIMGHGFKAESIPCPESTGSYLGYDGENLFLSQFYKGRIFVIEQDGSIGREIAVGAQTCGFVFVDGVIFCIRGDEATCDWRVARIDPREDTPVPHDLASIPFQARSLGHDGNRFWTNDRSANTIVSFALPKN